MNRWLKALIFVAVLLIGLSLLFTSTTVQEFLADKVGIVFNPSSTAGANRQANYIRENLPLLKSGYDARGIAVEGINEDTVFILKWEVKGSVYYGVSPRKDKTEVYTESDFEKATPLSSLLIKGELSYEQFYEDLLGDVKPKPNHEDVRIIQK